MSDPAAPDDETTIPLLGRPTTRRGVLGAAGAMLGSALYVQGATSPPTVRGYETAVVGEGPRVDVHELEQAGTLRELFVGVRHEHFPPVQETPSLRLVLDGDWRIDMGGTTSPGSTSTLRTNVASIVTRASYTATKGTDKPALRFSRTGAPAIGVVLEGPPSQRTGVGGGTAEINVGATSADLPSSPPEPSVQLAVDGDWEVWA